MTEPWATLAHISHQRDVQLQAEIDELRPRALASDHALDSLRARLLGQAPPPEPEFVPPGHEDFEHDQCVMAFDGSLLHTGFVLMDWPAWSTQPLVSARETLNIETQMKGYEGTWDTAFQLRGELRRIFRDWGHFSWVCGIEALPVGNSALRRTESSLIAGTEIYCVATAYSMAIRHPSVNHISSVLLGNVHHDKKAIAAAVLRYIPDSGKRDWSEAQRDAAAVGLTVLYDLRREHEQRESSRAGEPADRAGHRRERPAS